jgi:hypothetical protein
MVQPPTSLWPNVPPLGHNLAAQDLARCARKVEVAWRT